MNNITDIKRTLLFLKNHGVNKINIRCIGKSQTKNEIFSTTEADEILKYIKRLEKDFNIYTTFNCFDTVEKNTVSDKNIKKIKFILLDIDPERPSGTASTDEQKEEAKKEYELSKAKAEETAKELDQLVLTFHVKSGESGRMFGSVSTKQIMTELRRLGYHFDKHVILDTHPIQSLGTTKVRLEIFKGVIGTISVKVLGTN